MDSRITVLLLALGSAALIVAGCGGGEGDGGGGATVIGQAVDDGTLQLLVAAVAEVGGKASGPTAANGVFTIAGVPTGTQTLSVTAPGHQRARQTVVLSRGQNDVGPVYLPPTLDPGKGAVTGTVVLAGSNAPVAGAVIRCGTAVAFSRSDGTGRFTLYNAPTGTVQATFTDPSSGAGTWRFITVVAAAAPVEIGTVILSFGPPPPPI